MLEHSVLSLPALRAAAEALAPARVLDALQPFIAPERLARIAAVVAGRTCTVVPVVEGLANAGNVSAVMRSAEALGYQAFHVIAGDTLYKHSRRTSQGAEKWLDLWEWTSPHDCVAYFKAHDYTVVATHLDDTAVPLGSVDFTRPTAVVFGNEHDGLSPAMLALADQRCVVPMAGFVQSFNISVAAALCLYHAYQDRLGRQGYHGDLTPAEREALQADFCLRSLKNARQILQRVV